MNLENTQNSLGQSRSFSSSQLQRNPNVWNGLAHDNLRPEDHESLLRTLRYAWIAFNKFWVELNAVPALRNGLENASLEQVEKLFKWLESAKDWNQQVTLPRLVPEAARPEIRAQFQDWMDSVQLSRVLRNQMAKLQYEVPADREGLMRAQSSLSLAMPLARQLGLERGTVIEVRQKIEELNSQLDRHARIQAFYSDLTSEGSVPEPLNRDEALLVFQSVDWASRTPSSVLLWRRPQILGPQQRIRILTWQDRARPALDLRKRLESHFELSRCDDSQKLRAIASALMTGGALRFFTASYKQAVKQYQDLLLGADTLIQKPAKESPEQMAEKLSEWAQYLELKLQFENHSEARAFFGNLFQGIDTSFAQALEANDWATAVRNDFYPPVQDEFGLGESVPSLQARPKQKDDEFIRKLVDWLFTANQLSMGQAVALVQSERAVDLKRDLSLSVYQAGEEFSELACSDEARLIEATRLLDSLRQLNFAEDVLLTALASLASWVEARIQLWDRIEKATFLRTALKAPAVLDDVDCAPLGAVIAYCEAVESVQLPDALRTMFLTAQGPTRMKDAVEMTAQARAALGAAQDHFLKLQQATQGQVRSLLGGPFGLLMERIQLALKQPETLGAYVQQLRASRSN